VRHEVVRVSAAVDRDDPLLVWHEGKRRFYRRKFDFDEARALYARGFTIGRLALRYGVHENAIRRVVVPGEADRQNEIHKRWRTTVCESCGGPAMKLTHGKKQHNPDGRVLCQACRGRVRRKPIRFGDGVVKVECGACKTWKPVAEFPPRVTRGLRAGAKVRARCRACDTAARQAYRDRHRVPCEGCGKPCLPLAFSRSAQPARSKFAAAARLKAGPVSPRT
jgi:hypothetical protein